MKMLPKKVLDEMVNTINVLYSKYNIMPHTIITTGDGSINCIFCNRYVLEFFEDGDIVYSDLHTGTVVDICNGDCACLMKKLDIIGKYCTRGKL